MMSMEKNFNRVNFLIDSYELKSAFNLLNEIIADSQSTAEYIADALNLKGLLVGAHAPSLSEFDYDYTGLLYYLKAFEYNRFELGVLFNILNSFSEIDIKQEYTRNNKHMFVKAYDILQYELFDSLSKDMQENLLSFSNKYDEFKKEISNKKS